MADCYLCGAAVARGQGFRRSVVTSYSQRIYITRSSGGSVGRSTGLRTLCAACASRLDQSRQGLGLRAPISFIVGLLGSGLALSMMKQAQSGFAVLLFFFFLLGGAGLLTYLLMSWLHNTSFQQQPTIATSAEQEPAPVVARTAEISAVDDLGFKSVEEAFESLIEQCAELGFSLLHCYEVEDTIDGRAAVQSRLLALHPLRFYEYLDEWSTAVLPAVLGKIQLAALYPLYQCIEAREAGNNAEIDRLLPSVEKMIPRHEGEAEAEYFTRAKSAIGEVSSLKEAAERFQEMSERTRNS